MGPALKTLDASYRAHAIPLGSVRYWSWLFAAPPARAPLLGVYALLAEWNALMDPATEVSASQIKLAWWREEIQRLIERAPVHPICRYLAALPRAADVPRVRAFTVDGDDPIGPFGAKAVGELGINPPPAAIANAILDATGIRIAKDRKSVV